MRRFLTITSCCLSLASCDKQHANTADAENPSASASSLRRTSSTVREGAHLAHHSLEKRFAEIETITGIERENALATIAWDTIETDEATARRAMGEMSPGTPAKNRLVRHLASRFSETNPDEAIAWALTIEHPEERLAALSAIATALAESQPQRAANLLSEYGQPGHELDIAAVQVVQRWAAQSAPDAAAWVTRFPESQTREAGLDIIASRWLATDAATAFQWFDKMPTSALRRETALALQSAIIIQPREIREQWLQHASSSIRSELENQTQDALKKVGNNIRAEPP